MGFERNVRFLSGEGNLHKGFKEALLYSILHFDLGETPSYSVRNVLS